MSFGGFGGVFGDAIFGDVVFADLGALSPSRRRGRGIGGQGFPDDFYAILAANEREAEFERRRLERELAEVHALVEAGLL